MKMDVFKSWLTRTPLAPLAYAADEWRWYCRGRLRGSFAQHNEDRWIVDHLGDRPGIYIDVGANYPIKISNTYLLYRKGWRGMTVEPIPRLFDRHCRLRPRDIHVNAAAGRAPGTLLFYELWPSCASTFEASQAEELIRRGRARLGRKYEVQIVPLRELVARHFPGQEIDLLSIDTEGHDTEVLEGLDWLITHPRVVVVEVSAVGRADDRAARFLLNQGYAHAATIACNAFFVRPD